MKQLVTPMLIFSLTLNAFGSNQNKITQDNVCVNEQLKIIGKAKSGHEKAVVDGIHSGATFAGVIMIPLAIASSAAWIFSYSTSSTNPALETPGVKEALMLAVVIAGSAIIISVGNNLVEEAFSPMGDFDFAKRNQNLFREADSISGTEMDTVSRVIASIMSYNNFGYTAISSGTTELSQAELMDIANKTKTFKTLSKVPDVNEIKQHLNGVVVKFLKDSSADEKCKLSPKEIYLSLILGTILDIIKTSELNLN